MVVGYIIAFLLVCIASYTDIKKCQIPNKISILPYLLGIILHVIYQDFKGIGQATISAIIVFVILLLLYIANGLGAGDVKFISGLSFLMESQLMWQLLFISFGIAGGIAIIIFTVRYVIKLLKLLKVQLINKKVMSEWVTPSPQLHALVNKINRMKQIPFMIAVLPAFMIVLYVEVIL